MVMKLDPIYLKKEVALLILMSCMSHCILYLYNIHDYHIRHP